MRTQSRGLQPMIAFGYACTSNGQPTWLDGAAVLANLTKISTGAVEILIDGEWFTIHRMNIFHERRLKPRRTGALRPFLVSEPIHIKVPARVLSIDESGKPTAILDTEELIRADSEVIRSERRVDPDRRRPF